MADEGIFASTADVEKKCGANASATSKAEAYCNNYLFQAESFINAKSRFNYSDVYATLNADLKGILQDTATNLAAIYVISYDMSGYTSRIEAEDMVNILRDAALRNLQLLGDKKVIDSIREV